MYVVEHGLTAAAGLTSHGDKMYLKSIVLDVRLCVVVRPPVVQSSASGSSQAGHQSSVSGRVERLYRLPGETVSGWLGQSKGVVTKRRAGPGLD